MRWLCLFLLGIISLSAKENSISKADAANGWILLFDGSSMFGWTQSQPGGWRVTDNALVFDGQQGSLLGTSVPFSDFDLRFDFKSATGRTPDLLIRYGSGENPEDDGYVVKLSGFSVAWPAGSIVSVAKSDLPPPLRNQWHSVEIECSGDTLNVSIDGHKAASGKDPRSKAGFLGFHGTAGTSIQLRNVRLKPYSLQALFNGSDLSNWRAVSPPEPKSAGRLKKMLKLRAAKPKEAQWTVQQNSIHAEGGSGELQSQSQHGDFILQFQARVENPGKGSDTVVRLRANAGQFATGYRVGVDAAHAGSLLGFAVSHQSVPASGDFAIETVAVAGRHFVIWLNGYPASEFDDTRPEAASVQKGAKSAAGPIAISTNAALDVRSMRSLDLPKALGIQKTVTAAVPTAVPAPVPASPPTAPLVPQAAPVSPTGTGAFAQQQLDDAKPKAEVKRLTAQALQETDPRKQMEDYAAILQVDPDNSFAAAGYRDTKQKLDQTAEQKQKQAQQSQHAASDEAKGQDALHNAESAFAAGNLPAASAHLAVAERLLPASPEVAKLRQAIDRVIQGRQRIKYLASGAGIIAWAGVVVLLFRRRGKKVPVLMVMDGIEKGKRFLLNAEVNHIGAVAQDGSARNEIVLRDVDRMISRFHCEILNKDGRLFLLDCGSSNGTFVNGKRLTPRRPTRLKGGSRFSVAKACALQVGYERRRDS